MSKIAEVYMDSYSYVFGLLALRVLEETMFMLKKTIFEVKTIDEIYLNDT